MSFQHQVSAVNAAASAPTPSTTPDDANGHLANSYPDSMVIRSWTEQVKVLKETIRKMLTFAVDHNKPQEKLNLVEAIHRLGIALHFEEEIQHELKKVYHDYQKDINGYGDDNLYFVALQFRLLRQQGYNVSSDVFSKFTDENGEFKEELASDVPGMLSLYEASYLSVHGEDVLDKALAFTATHLKSLASKLRLPLAERVSHALIRPVHKGVSKLEAWSYISMYQKEELHIEALLKMAKLEFNILQKLQQEELTAVSKWLEATKLPFPRDRMVRCYFWAFGVFPDPKYDRVMLAKSVIFAAAVDNTFHYSCGSLDQAELFSKAMKRLDVSIEDELPDHMKICCHALFNFFTELEQEMAHRGRPYCMFYVKEEMKKLADAYVTEASWLNKGYVPTIEECLQIGWITTSQHLLTVISLCGMGEIASKDAFDWMVTEPKIAKASSVICKLMSDIVFHKFKIDRGNLVSAVKCHMNQRGVSEEEAYEELDKLVAEAWKDMNEEVITIRESIGVAQCRCSLAS